jgi:hypothetical protein
MNITRFVSARGTPGIHADCGPERAGRGSAFIAAASGDEGLVDITEKERN